MTKNNNTDDVTNDRLIVGEINFSYYFFAILNEIATITKTLDTSLTQMWKNISYLFLYTKEIFSPTDTQINIFIDNISNADNVMIKNSDVRKIIDKYKTEYNESINLTESSDPLNLYDYEINENKIIYTINDGFFGNKQIWPIYHNYLSNLYLPINKFNKLKEDYSMSAILQLIMRYKIFKINYYKLDIEYIDSINPVYEFVSNSLCSNTNNYSTFFYSVDNIFGSGDIFYSDIWSNDKNISTYIIDLVWSSHLLNSFYEKIKLNIEPKSIIILNIPLWRKYILEEKIENEKIYKFRQIKIEYQENVFTGEIKLRKPYICYVFCGNNYNKNIVENVLSYKNYNFDFPYRNKFTDNETRLSLFYQLEKEKYVVLKSSKRVRYTNVKLNNVYNLYVNGEYLYFCLDDIHKYSLYYLSDLFNDECRAICKFDNNISPLDYFSLHKYDIVNRIVNKGLDINPNNIREQIFLLSKECSTHNPLLIKYFIDKYKAKRILDFSSGWGDRLIGALLADVDYYLGVDPNECLHKNYKKMIQLFRPNKTDNYQTRISAFEQYNLDESMNGTFDLVYTSPPYFDYENYVDKNTRNNTQSMESFKSEESWLNKFLYRSLDKCISAIKFDGHIVLYISQKHDKSYVEKMFYWLKNKKNIYYIGNIFKSNMKMEKIHPIYIFNKSKDIPVNLYNPPIRISSYTIKNKLLNVIRDDLLIGGTKTRASVLYLKQFLENNPKIKTLVYTGASNGYGQVAVARSLDLLKSSIKFLIYSQNTKLNYVGKIKSIVTSLYPNTTYVNVNMGSKEIWKIINDLISKKNSSTFEIPFGLGDDVFKNIFKQSLKSVLHDYVKVIKRLWIVGGSSTIFQVLYDILPNTKFHLVQVGKKILLDNNYYSDSVSRVKLYVSSYKLYEDIKQTDMNIPYPTVPSYDGKIWEFFDDFENGDFIWNVAGIHNKI
jgi:16S rRNA G966 N2-methylase RsmD